MQGRIVSFEIPAELVSEAEILAVQMRMELRELACRAFTEHLWQIRTTAHRHRVAGSVPLSPSSAELSAYDGFDVNVWTDFPDVDERPR